MSFCINCGAKVQDGAAFCISCGTPVSNSEKKTEAQFNNGYTAQENSAPNYQQPKGSYRANVPKRDLAMCIILSIVTCGIYGLYWYYMLINELNVVAPDEDSPNAITVILLTVVTCGIYGYFWLYKAGNRLDTVRQLNGEAASSLGLLFVILALCQLAIADYALIQNELNKVSLN